MYHKLNDDTSSIEVFKLIGIVPLSYSLERYCKSTTRSFVQSKSIAAAYLLVSDDVGFRILVKTCTLGICINCAVVDTALVEKVKFYYRLMTVSITLAANIPIVTAFPLSGNCDKFGRLSLKIF